MTPRLEALRAAQQAQRRFLMWAIILPCAALMTGWYLAAAVAMIQQGPGVAPW